jgi:hypothetical protein
MNNKPKKKKKESPPPKKKISLEIGAGCRLSKFM